MVGVFGPGISSGQQVHPICVQLGVFEDQGRRNTYAAGPSPCSEVFPAHAAKAIPQSSSRPGVLEFKPGQYDDRSYSYRGAPPPWLRFSWPNMISANAEMPALSVSVHSGLVGSQAPALAPTGLSKQIVLANVTVASDLPILALRNLTHLPFPGPFQFEYPHRALCFVRTYHRSIPVHD